LAVGVICAAIVLQGAAAGGAYAASARPAMVGHRIMVERPIETIRAVVLMQQARCIMLDTPSDSAATTDSAYGSGLLQA